MGKILDIHGGPKQGAISPLAEAVDGDIDLLLLKDSLTKTPWQRMQANDDALNFGNSLRSAMEERNAKFK